MENLDRAHDVIKSLRSGEPMTCDVCGKPTNVLIMTESDTLVCVECYEHPTPILPGLDEEAK